VAPSTAVQVQPPASVLRSALTIAVAAAASTGGGDSGVAPLTIGLAAGIPGFVLLLALAAGIFIHRRRSRAGSSNGGTASVTSRPGRRGEHRTQNAFLDAASRAWAERTRVQQPAAASPAVANFRSPMWAGSQAQRQEVAAAGSAGRSGNGGRAGASPSKGRTLRPGPGVATSRSAVQPRGGAEEDVAFDSDASAVAGTGLKAAPPGLRLDLASMSRRRFQGPAAGAPAGGAAPGEGAQAGQRKVIPARTLSDRNLALLGIYSGSAAGGVTARSAAGRGPAAVRRPQLRTRTRAAESGDGDDETSAAEAAPEPRRRKQREVADSGSEGEGEEGVGDLDGEAEGAPAAAGDAGQLPGEMRSPASFARGLVTASNARKVARSATRGRIVTDAPSVIGSNPAGAVPGGRRLRTARAPTAGASKPGGAVRRPGQQPHLTAPAVSAARTDTGDDAEEHVSVDVVVSGGAPRVRPSRGIPLRIDPDAEEGSPDEEATAEAHTAAAATPRVVDPELGPAGVLTFGAPSPTATDSELSLHRKATERKLAALGGPSPLPASLDAVYGELAAGGRDNKLRRAQSRSPRAAAASAALTFDETPASARSPTGTSPHMEPHRSIPAAADSTLRALAASLSPDSLRAGTGMRGPAPRGGFASAGAPASAAALPPGVPNPVRGPLGHAFSSRNLSALLRKQRATPSAAGTGLHGGQGGVFHGGAGEEAGAYEDFASSAHPDLNPLPHQSWHRTAPSYGSAASALSDPPLPEDPYADPDVAAAAFEAAEAAAAGFAGAVYRPLSAAHAGGYVYDDPDAGAAYGLRSVGSGHFDPPYDPSDADASAGSAYGGPHDHVSGRVLRAVSGVGARAYSSAPLGAGTGARQPAPPAGRASSRAGGGGPGAVSRPGASASRKRAVGTPSQRQVAGTLSPSASSVAMRGLGSPYGAY
jgi:hypothetical protein